MNAIPQCPDCDKLMEKGFILDFGYGTGAHSVFQTSWHPGDAEPRKFYWFDTRSVKVEPSEARKIISYRCPDCDMLRSYAQ